MHVPMKLVSLSVLTAIAVMGCGKEAPPPPPPVQAPPPAPPMVIKIGSVAPLTGGIAHLGKDNENGVRMAIDEANAAGVTIGGKKVKFELMAEDDAADPKQGTAAAQKLCESKVAGVIGHLNSGTTIPASNVYNDCGIPMVTGAATNPNLTDRKSVV